MRRKIKYLSVLMTTALLCVSVAGCKGESKKENKSTVETNTVSEKVETESSTTKLEVSSSEKDSDNETTSDKETTTSLSEETTTKVAEQTTKKEETTTKKQETTTKKQETTTKKQETTTKKPVSTTKKEETTTKKQEETTTKAPETPKTWFAKKGYKITLKSKVLSAINSNETREEYKCNLVMEESIWEENPEYKWISWWITDGEDNWISVCPFDKYTGVEYETGFKYADGYMSTTRTINGKEVTIYMDGAMAGNSYYKGIAVPKDYDGIVFVCGGSNAGKIKYNEEIDRNNGPFLLDEYCSFDEDDIYFISADDK